MSSNDCIVLADEVTAGQTLNNTSPVIVLADEVTAGQPLNNTSPEKILSSIPQRIACVVEVSNYTKWELSSPDMYMAQGLIHKPPVSIKPGKKDIFSFHKSKWLFYGCGGVCVWQVDKYDTDDKSKFIALAPYIPHQHGWSQNSLSVAILDEETYKKEDFNGEELFRCINNQPFKGEVVVSYARKSYATTIESITHEKDGIFIEGTFGSAFKAIASVKIYPTEEKNLHKIKR